MPEQISDLESFATALGDYIGTLECITGQLVEPPAAGVSLPAEYRWEVVANTRYLLEEPSSTFSKVEQEAIIAFVAVVEKVPADAPELTSWEWKKAQLAAGKLLPVLRSRQLELPASR